MCCNNKSVESFIGKFNEKRHQLANLNYIPSQTNKGNVNLSSSVPIRKPQPFVKREQIFNLNGSVKHTRPATTITQTPYLSILTKTKPTTIISNR